MDRWHPHRLLASLAVAALLLLAAASAQTSATQAYVNDVVGPQEVISTAGLPSLSYEIDLTLLDAQQNVISSAGVMSATMALDPNGSYPAQVAQIAAPWSVAVLLDASSTVGFFSAGADYTLMLSQVSDAIGKMPDGYNFSVEKFDVLPNTILDFTSDKMRVSNAILKGFQPATSDNACLNDAVFDAINNLSRAPGRRALLVVTASLDGCGKSADQALALAKQNHIPIFAVAMLGYKVTAAENLNYLTAPTGGLAYARESKDLKFALLNVSQALKLQWSAKATLYPSAGPETATVQLTLTDQTQITTKPVFFSVNKSFARPAHISLRGAVLSTQQGIRFGLDVVSPQLISQLKLNVTSKVTGESVNQQTLALNQKTYDVPIKNLTAAGTYLLQVTALDGTGAQVDQAGAEFQYQPPKGVLSIADVITPTRQLPQFELKVSETDLVGVVKHRVWLQTDGQTDKINVTEVALGSPIAVPITDLKTGIYEVVVDALDGANTVMAEAVSGKQQYTAPSSFDLTLEWLAKNQWAVLLLAGVGCVAGVGMLGALVIILPKPNARPKTVELFVPDVKHRAAPVNLEAGRSQPLPRVAAARRGPPDQSEPVREAPPPGLAGQQGMARPGPAAPAGMPKACLSGYAPADLRVAATIGKASYTIGRRDGNDLVLKVDNKVGVSGRHATIKFVDGRFFIADDRSTFGTFVNDLKLPAGATLPLEDGAVIGLGPKVKIQFRLNCP